MVAQRVPTTVGARAWSIHGRTPLTGFAHGAAGIGYALLRLHEASGDAEFQDAAREGFAYESALFASEQSNWPDLRGADRHSANRRFMTSWCHGAPGIALSRLPCLGAPAARRDLEAGIATTTGLGAAGTDTLCCGSFGRGEIMTAAGLQLSRPELLSAARSQAAIVLERRSRTGAFRLRPGHLIEAHSPGLFSGVAGIGYQLLRLASPHQVPSVLLWECRFGRSAQAGGAAT